MTPSKEKAQQLIYAFEAFTDRDNELEFAKQCAAIAVDEILDSFKLNTGIDIVGSSVLNFAIRERNYWEEVKKEIELL